MNIEVSSDGSVTLQKVFLGIGIETETGLYGVSQRDGGIEIMHNGKLLVSLVGDTITIFSGYLEPIVGSGNIIEEAVVSEGK